MAKQIFVNLPVKDLGKTRDFFSKLGFTFNEQFSDENAACMVIDDNIFSMLLTEPFFKTFINKEVADATKTAEAIISLSAGSREEVDEMVRKAVAGGGTITKDAQDHGWMYQASFADLDGHQWEVCFMDEEMLKQQMAGQPEAAQDQPDQVQDEPHTSILPD